MRAFSNKWPLRRRTTHEGALLTVVSLFYSLEPIIQTTPSSYARAWQDLL